jgi:intracellular multiplication protein IcmO
MHGDETLALARRLADSVADGAWKTAGALCVLAAAASSHPLFALAATACGAALVSLRVARRRGDPLGRTPREARALDEGFALCLGSEARTGRPVLLDANDMRRDVLVLGTPGPAKTDFLLGLSEQVVAAGSGLMFVDAKEDASVFAKVFAMARRHGRLDDLLVLDLTAWRAHDDGATSNATNPFATGSPDALTRLAVGLLDWTGHEGAMWQPRAEELAAGLLGALAWMRDRGEIDLTPGSLRDHLNLRAIVGLASGDSAPGLPDGIRAGLARYLESLPGYNPERGVRQAQLTLDHHGYLEMQFTKVLGSLNDVHGHAFGAPEIDMQDVVLSRRILVVMLPNLEAMSEHHAGPGRYVLAGLLRAMQEGLANRIEVPCGGVVDNRAFDSRVPFLCVLDEVGFYAVDGVALTSTKARCLGYAMVYGSRNVPVLGCVSRTEAASVIANTSMKIFMRTEEDGNAGAGRPWEAASPGQVDGINLSELDPGEILATWKARPVRARGVAFAPDPGASPPARPNRLRTLPRADAGMELVR